MNQSHHHSVQGQIQQPTGHHHSRHSSHEATIPSPYPDANSNNLPSNIIFSSSNNTNNNNQTPSATTNTATGVSIDTNSTLPLPQLPTPPSSSNNTLSASTENTVFSLMDLSKQALPPPVFNNNTSTSSNNDQENAFRAVFNKRPTSADFAHNNSNGNSLFDIKSTVKNEQTPLEYTAPPVVNHQAAPVMPTLSPPIAPTTRVVSRIEECNEVAAEPLIKGPKFAALLETLKRRNFPYELVVKIARLSGPLCKLCSIPSQLEKVTGDICDPCASKGRGKKNLTAFMFFCKEKRPEIRDANPQASFGELGKLMGAAWRALSDHGKKRFNDLAQQDKIRYDKQVAIFGPPPKKPVKKSPSANSGNNNNNNSNNNNTMNPVDVNSQIAQLNHQIRMLQNAHQIQLQQTRLHQQQAEQAHQAAAAAQAAAAQIQNSHLAAQQSNGMRSPPPVLSRPPSATSSGRQSPATSSPVGHSGAIKSEPSVSKDGMSPTDPHGQRYQSHSRSNSTGGLASPQMHAQVLNHGQHQYQHQQYRPQQPQQRPQTPQEYRSAASPTSTAPPGNTLAVNQHQYYHHQQQQQQQQQQQHMHRPGQSPTLQRPMLPPAHHHPNQQYQPQLHPLPQMHAGVSAHHQQQHQHQQ